MDSRHTIPANLRDAKALGVGYFLQQNLSALLLLLEVFDGVADVVLYKLVRSYVRTFDFPVLITRSPNNYGPYQFPEKFLPLLITNALDDKALPIYGDGKQQRNWLHVDDNCHGIMAVLERGRIGEVYNIGSLDVEENLSIARRLLQLVGKPETLLSYVRDRPGHDRRYALKCDKMERELGWTPSISLDDGLRQTIDWYKMNVGWMAGIRGGEYRSYYEKYYKNRDSRHRG